MQELFTEQNTEKESLSVVRCNMKHIDNTLYFGTVQSYNTIANLT